MSNEVEKKSQHLYKFAEKVLSNRKKWKPKKKIEIKSSACMF